MDKIKGLSEVCLTILSGGMIIGGTYMLSRNVFKNSIQKLISFSFKDLPFYIQFIILIFGYKGAFESLTLFDKDPFPTSVDFTCSQKMMIIEPFVGFILITLGTVIALVF